MEIIGLPSFELLEGDHDTLVNQFLDDALVLFLGAIANVDFVWLTDFDFLIDVLSNMWW